MKFEKHFTNKIISRLMEASEKEINVAEVARTVDTDHVSVWSKVTGQRKWDAETWLKAMFALGYAHFSTMHGGSIRLKAPLSENEMRKLAKYRNPSVYIGDNVGKKKNDGQKISKSRATSRTKQTVSSSHGASA